MLFHSAITIELGHLLSRVACLSCMMNIDIDEVVIDCFASCTVRSVASLNNNGTTFRIDGNTVP